MTGVRSTHAPAQVMGLLPAKDRVHRLAGSSESSGCGCDIAAVLADGLFDGRFLCGSSLHVERFPDDHISRDSDSIGQDARRYADRGILVEAAGDSLEVFEGLDFLSGKFDVEADSHRYPQSCAITSRKIPF